MDFGNSAHDTRAVDLETTMRKMQTLVALFGFALMATVSFGALAQTTGSPHDAPEISRSVGVENGVVVFWPRIIPGSETASAQQLAGALQAHVVSLVEQALPGRTVNVRPEPERVCPMAGCLAMTVGVLLLKRDTGCAVVALVSGPGQAPAKLIRWVGLLNLTQDQVPFREPPESVVRITDFARCDEVLESLGHADNDVATAIHEASQ